MMLLNGQEHRQDTQNRVIFSGRLCSLLGRGAQGAYANEARSRRRLALYRGTKGAAKTASMPKAAMFQNSERMSGIPDI